MIAVVELNWKIVGLLRTKCDQLCDSAAKRLSFLTGVLLSTLSEYRQECPCPIVRRPASFGTDLNASAKGLIHEYRNTTSRRDCSTMGTRTTSRSM